ncbi:MAG: acylphosphatase [Gammaproteobacteria bacterium]|nr:acylphosphatase [Gammaproteobacteria bacterium]
MHSIKGYVTGHVQGVGFRYFVRSQAQQHGLSGYAHNLADGRVEFLLQGEPSAVEQVIALIGNGPRYARVDAVSLDAARDLPVSEEFGTL